MHKNESSSAGVGEGGGGTILYAHKKLSPKHILITMVI